MSNASVPSVGINRSQVGFVERYEIYLDHSIQLNRWILKPIGVWPLDQHTTMIERNLYRIINGVCYSLILFLLIPCSLYIILEDEVTYYKLKLSGPMIFITMAVGKYFSLIIRESDLKCCLGYIEEDWKNIVHVNDRQIMMSNANFGRRLIIICAIFMYGGLVGYYLVVPFVVGKVTSEDGNFTYIPLLYPMPSMFVDARRNPINEIFFALQCLSGFIVHSIVIATCSLAALFVMHACGQLQVLMNWFQYLVEGRKGEVEDVDERLTRIIQHHVRVLSFIALVEKILHKISLMEILGCTLNICQLGYYVLVEWEQSGPLESVIFTILLTSISFNIFIFCYIGELLVEQCKKVGEMSYMADWYELPGKKSLSLVLMIAMSNSSIKLTAGKLIELSLSSFGDVIKTSIAYLNVLRKITS